jgi:cystathionine beta-lyase/cystathionine gamma-synthase
VSEPAAGPASASPARRRFRPLPSWAGPATRLVHGGQFPDLNAGALSPPVYLSSTFRYPAAYSEASGHGDVYLYSRERNPSVEGAEEVVRELEGGEAARLFASGMGAISASVLSVVRAGDEVVAPEGLYGGTTELLRDWLPRYGVTSRLLADREAGEPEQALSAKTRLVVLETPTNPLLRVHDIRRWAEAAHRVGATLLVDNTFASPVNQRPLGLGADLVAHSATKYLGGHTDLTGGAVVGATRRVEAIDPKHLLGAPLGPFEGYLLHRSLKTLVLRVTRQTENAARLVAALAEHPAVERVHYPGRYSAAEEEVAARQMRGRGAMVALSLRGGRAAVDRFLGRLRIVQVASSLGGVESLVSVPVDTSHRGLSPAERASRGITEGLIRLSVGIEEGEDLIRDVREALEVPGERSSPPL